MQTQQVISKQRLQQKIGTQQRVIIDAVDPETQQLIGRSSADAPEIDGLVYITSDKSHAPGSVIDVNIDDADEYDLFGTAL